MIGSVSGQSDTLAQLAAMRAAQAESASTNGASATGATATATGSQPGSTVSGNTTGDLSDDLMSMLTDLNSLVSNLTGGAGDATPSISSNGASSGGSTSDNSGMAIAASGNPANGSSASGTSDTLIQQLSQAVAAYAQSAATQDVSAGAVVGSIVA